MTATTPTTTGSNITGPVKITGPLSIADLLDRTFRALRARFGVLVLSAAIVMVPMGLLAALLTGRFMTGYFDLLELAALPPDAAQPELEAFFGEFAGYFGVLILLLLFNLLGTVLVNLMSIYHIDHFLHGSPSTVGEGLRVALRRFLPMIEMRFLYLMAVGTATAVIAFVAALLFVLVAVVFGGAMAGFGNENANAILIVGFVLLFIVGYLVLILLMLAPILYFTARWVAAGPSLLIEGLGPVKALGRSWTLTKGRLWRCILFVVLLSIFSAVVISLPLAVTQQVAMILLPSQLDLILVLSTVASYLLNLLYQPFYATGIVMLYYDLRVRAEAYDVALRVAALEDELAKDATAA
jgi:hypothetical protein